MGQLRHLTFRAIIPDPEQNTPTEAIGEFICSSAILNPEAWLHHLLEQQDLILVKIESNLETSLQRFPEAKREDISQALQKKTFWLRATLVC